MRWAVEIQRTSLDSQNLSDLVAALGFELVDGIDYPAVSSPKFEQMDTSQQVWAAAKELRDALSGPAAVDPDFTLGGVIDYSTDKPKRDLFLEPEPVRLMVATMSATISVGPPQGLSEEELQEWEDSQGERDYRAKLEHQLKRLEPAFKEPRAAKVLELIGRDEHTGESINKIYELAEGHPKHRKQFHAQFDIQKDEFDRFRDAIHNASVSGDKARHAYPEEPRTSNPMTLHEAERFAVRVAKEWMASIR